MKNIRISLIIILTGILILFKPPIDPDFGWHFKYGEYIIQNGKFLRENIFSYSMPNYKWANSYWIPQIIMYSLYSATGAIGMGLVLSLVTSVGIVLILKKACLEKWPILIGSPFLFTILSSYLITVRPLLFSTLFMLLLLYTLLYKPKNIVYLPLLFLFWANAHADFTLGLFVLGIFNIQKLLTEGIKKENLLIHVSSLLCIPITLINPYGFFLWETLLKETHPLQFSHIQEWLPLEGKGQAEIYVISSAMIITSLIEMKEKKKNLWLIFCAGFFFIASIRSAYFGRVFILLGTFPSLNFLAQMKEETKSIFDFLGGKNILRIEKSAKIMGIIGLICAGGLFMEKVWQASSEERWATKAGYPYERVQEIKRLIEKGEAPEGNMFNEYSWGGYLIWKLPEYKTFIDGRMPSWRDESGYSVFEEYVEIKNNLPKRSLDNYSIVTYIVKEFSYEKN